MSWRLAEFNDCAALPLGFVGFITVAHSRLFVFGADNINFLGTAVWSMPANGGTLQVTGGSPLLTNFGAYCQGNCETDVIVAGGSGNDPDYLATNDLVVVRCLPSGSIQVIGTYKLPVAAEGGGTGNILLHKGYLYLIPGVDGATSTYTPACYRVKVSPKYEFGSWETLPDMPHTTVLGTTRGLVNNKLVGIGDYIYSVGGANSVDNSVVGYKDYGILAARVDSGGGFSGFGPEQRIPIVGRETNGFPNVYKTKGNHIFVNSGKVSGQGNPPPDQQEIELVVERGVITQAKLSDNFTIESLIAFHVNGNEAYGLGTKGVTSTGPFVYWRRSV